MSAKPSDIGEHRNRRRPGSGYVIRDRVVDHDPADARRRGQLLARVRDVKTFAGSYTTFTLTTSFEFSHTLAEVAQLVDDRVLLLSFDELGSTFDHGGRKITRRERAAYRRRHGAPPEQPADTEFSVADRRLPDIDAMESCPVGQVLAAPLDLRTTAAGFMIVEFRTSPAVAHSLVDAWTLSRGHQLLVTVDELPESADSG